VLDSHGQQLSNEGLEKLAKDLSQQKDEEEETDEDPPLKCM
jgi:hypothetical protein